MSDLISRQAAIEEIKAVYEWHDTVTKERIIEHLIYLPSAEPEIITCKNCKYGDTKPVADGSLWCNRHNAYMKYCSDVERRTDENPDIS